MIWFWLIQILPGSFIQSCYVLFGAIWSMTSKWLNCQKLRQFVVILMMTK